MDQRNKEKVIQMAIYVISDIHGEADLFHSMLKRIQFSSADTLYILGDVIDRGPDGISLLQEIMSTFNMKMLLGNHEYMMMQYYSPDATDVEVFRWRRNGNESTVAAFENLSADLQEEMLSFLRNLPTHEKLIVGERCYFLVHGFPGENVHDEVWVRPDLHAKNPINGAALVIGHTPVIHMACSKADRDTYTIDMLSRGEHPRILHTDGFIDIDCGCSYEPPLKTLGCLRLDDMEEFYESSVLSGKCDI